MITILVWVCRNYLHYVLILHDLDRLADCLVYPDNLGIISDILLGIILVAIDYYGFGSDYSKKKSLRHIGQVILLSITFFLGLYICPYDKIWDILSEKILSPIFSMQMQSTFLSGAENMDIEILRDTFYWHFFPDELVLMEWIVTYFTFQICAQIISRKDKFRPTDCAKDS